MNELIEKDAKRNRDTFLKKCVIGGAAVMLVIFSILLWHEDSFMGGILAVIVGDDELLNVMDTAYEKEKKEFEESMERRREISGDIKRGSDEVTRNISSLKNEVEDHQQQVEQHLTQSAKQMRSAFDEAFKGMDEYFHEHKHSSSFNSQSASRPKFKPDAVGIHP